MRQFGLGWNAPRTYALPGIYCIEDLRFFLYTFRKCTLVDWLKRFFIPFSVHYTGRYTDLTFYRDLHCYINISQ